MKPRRKSSAVTLPSLASLAKAERPGVAKVRLAALGEPLAYDVQVSAGAVMIRQRQPHSRTRRLKVDNVGTPGHPVDRYRVATPLTPYPVRQMLLTAPGWLETAEAALWVERQRRELPRLLTPLDRLLDDEQAWALERYIENEELLRGLIRVPLWQGERVDTTTRNSAPLPDRALAGLAAHARATRRLTKRARAVLVLFHAQMREDGLSAAQAAMRLGLAGRRKAVVWWEAVASAAAELVDVGY